MRRPRAERRRPSRDTVATAGGAVLFALSLGLATVALPLLAIQAGYSAAEIGVLTATSALSQMATRLVLGPAMRVIPEWVLVVSAGVLLAASSGLVATSAALAAFVTAQLMQGVARACFWTGTQTHVVRGDRPAVGGLAMVNLLANTGLVLGPVLAGVLTERSPQLALGVGAVIAALGCVPAVLLKRLPPFSPPSDRSPGRLWRRPGVDVGCWAGVTTGTWRGLLGSYIPVALSAAALSSSTIGVLVAVASSAALAGAGIVGRIRRPARLAWSYALGAAATGIATALIGLLAGSPWAVGAALAVSGLGAGALQTVGPAMAAESVHPQERGDVIAMTGTFRAGALFVAPLAIAGMLAAVPLTVAMGVAGTAVALPALSVRRLQRRLRPAAPLQQTGV